MVAEAVATEQRVVFVATVFVEPFGWCLGPQEGAEVVAVWWWVVLRQCPHPTPLSWAVCGLILPTLSPYLSFSCWSSARHFLLGCWAPFFLSLCAKGDYFFLWEGAWDRMLVRSGGLGYGVSGPLLLQFLDRW